MERQLPDVTGILSGAYIRHSPRWLEWRVADRRGKLDSLTKRRATIAARLPLLDDLGVAYDKLGRHDEAIDVGREACEIASSRYQSLANLGTYLAHAGRTAEGVALLRRAIEVNPDAHFGRERVEIAVFEYVELRRHEGRIELPLFDPEAKGDRAIGLSAFLAARRTPKGTTVLPLSPDERAAAAQGVVGMMYSTRNDDPVLLEVLAHTLVDPNESWLSLESARRFAAGAYLSAARYVSTPGIALAYRRLAADVLEAPESIGPDGAIVPDSRLADVEQSLTDDRQSAEAAHATLCADEADWIATAPDPEAAFIAKYLEPKAADLVRVGFRKRTSPQPAVVSAIAPASRAEGTAISPPQGRALPWAALAAVAALFVGAGALGWTTSHARRPDLRRRTLVRARRR